jgi:hypothetical protein
MLERLTEVLCEIDDFCQTFEAQWQTYPLGTEAVPREPKPGLSVSEIITLLPVLHSFRFKYLKNFYQGIAMPLLRPCFPGLPCYEQFVMVQKRAFVPLMFFLLSRMGQTDRHLLHRQHIFAGMRQSPHPSS